MDNNAAQLRSTTPMGFKRISMIMILAVRPLAIRSCVTKYGGTEVASLVWLPWIRYTMEAALLPAKQAIPMTRLPALAMLLSLQRQAFPSTLLSVAPAGI